MLEAEGVSTRILLDRQITPAALESLWKTPVTAVLQRPLPFDTTCPTKHCVLLEDMESADPTGADPAPLRERIWNILRLAVLSTAQRTAILLLLGVSGAGKTKCAFDIGRKHALLIFSRVYEKGVKGSLTRPWQLLVQVLGALQGQLRRGASPAAAAASGLARVDADSDSPDGPLPESTAAVAAIIVLLACHVEWVAMVCAAAARNITSGAAAADGAATSDVTAAMREVAVRAQRNGTAFDNVSGLFCLRLLHLLATGGLHESGRVSLSISAAMLALAHAEAMLVRAVGSQTTADAVPQPLPTFVCIDEFGALLDHVSLDGLFKGTFAEVPEAPSCITLPGASSLIAEAGGEPISFPALPDDLDATRRSAQMKPAQGLLYGVLVALRHVMSKHAWGHLLCGTNLRPDTALLNAHSPAQGVSTCMDADTALDVPALRKWFGQYLTERAMEGVDDASLSRLVGRPLYASFFWAEVHGSLGPDGAGVTLPFDAAAMVRGALRRAIVAAGVEADVRISALWSSSFEIRNLGSRPNLLLAWLYYLQRMGWGSTTLLSPPSCSSEVMDAVTRGVLHLRRDQRTFLLASEPVTMESIVRVGALQTARSSLSTDAVLQALARRVSGIFGDADAKGNASEDVIAWVLLRRGGERILLRDLFAPFMSGMTATLFPSSLADQYVLLSAGLHCDIALGEQSSTRCFLDLLARPGGGTLLLHHTQKSAGGADLAFVAYGACEPDEPPTPRLVMLQIRNKVGGTLAQMLPTVDLGTWFPDNSCGETRSHAALRAVMVAQPSWLDPVCVLCSSRRATDASVLEASWMNTALVPQQPIVFLQFTQQNTGANVLQSLATAAMEPPRVASATWWPTQLRHWPEGSPHPQGYLLAASVGRGLTFETPSCTVLFMNVASGQDHRMALHTVARNFGVCHEAFRPASGPQMAMTARRSLRSSAAIASTRLTVIYDSFECAINAVCAGHLNRLLIPGPAGDDDLPVSAFFVPDARPRLAGSLSPSVFSASLGGTTSTAPHASRKRQR